MSETVFLLSPCARLYLPLYPSAAGSWGGWDESPRRCQDINTIPPGAPHLPSPGVFLFRTALPPQGNIMFTCRMTGQGERGPAAEGTAGDGDGAGPGRAVRVHVQDAVALGAV